MLLLLGMMAFGLLCLLDYIKRQYWIRKGVVQGSNIPFLGSFYPVVTLKSGAFGVYDNAVKKSPNSPYVGIYEFWRPVLVLKDPNIIEHVLIKDFSHFLDHPRWIFDVTSIAHDSLFTLTGNRWRALRYHTIPWFTTGRMKSLYPQVFNSISLPEGEFNSMAYLRLLTANVMATFLNVQINDHEEFQKINRSFHDVNTLRFYRLLLIEHFSKFTDAIGLTMADLPTDNYFRHFVKVALSNKDHTLVQRFQKMLDDEKITMRKKDLYTNVADDEMLSYEVSEELFTQITGQFLIGGLDTTSNTMAWLIYDLAMHPQVQSIAREEIRNELKKHNGDWSYECVQSMKYVANCLHESMRLHPTLPYMFRVCTTKYTTPDGLTIDAGTKLIIPSLNIHMNPEVYPEPELYKPERFGSIEKQTNLNWLPFGEGPRKCAGMRFAQMTIRTMMARLLENHEIVFTEKTVFPVVNNDLTFLGRPLNPVYCKLKRVH